ncbi:MAG: tyrosine--tRNA ligase [Gemmataceae bacterium]
MKSVTEQLALLRRGVDQITPLEDMVKKLERSVKTGKPLRIKYGIDPTGIDVHLGHTVPLRKLRLFQELGHQAVLIIGNYTALVGDPSGRDQTRARLTQEQVEANARDYLAQVSKVIDITRTEVRYNGEWFSRFSFLEVMQLMGRITVQRMLERDDFTKRIGSGTPISLHECLYPLMQGHDSVEIQADVELGGSEQLFNLMMGRRLQEDAGQEAQVCLTLPILRGLDGERRMGKSLGNYVGVGMAAQEQFDRTMSIPDTIMREWYDLLTDRPAEEVALLLDPAQTHPMEAKKQLAAEIVTFYHGAPAAQAARGEWERTKSQRQDPTEIPEVQLQGSALAEGKIQAYKLIVALGMAPSNNEARRLVQGGGMNTGPDRAKVVDPNASIEVASGLIVRVGNRKIARVRVV